MLERRYPTWREDEKARRRAVAALQRLGYSFEQVRASWAGWIRNKREAGRQSGFFFVRMGKSLPEPTPVP